MLLSNFFSEGKSFRSMQTLLLLSCSLVAILLFAVGTLAAVGGSITGTIKDSTRGVIPGAMIKVTNTAVRTEFKTMTDARGYFSFPNLAVGTYDLLIDL